MDPGSNKYRRAIRNRKRRKPRATEQGYVSCPKAYDNEVSSFLASTSLVIQRMACAQIYCLPSFDPIIREQIVGCVRDKHPNMSPWTKRGLNGFGGKPEWENNLRWALDRATAPWMEFAFLGGGVDAWVAFGAM